MVHAARITPPQRAHGTIISIPLADRHMAINNTRIAVLGLDFAAQSSQFRQSSARCEPWAMPPLPTVFFHRTRFVAQDADSCAARRHRYLVTDGVARGSSSTLVWRGRRRRAERLIQHFHPMSDRNIGARLQMLDTADVCGQDVLRARRGEAGDL